MEDLYDPEEKILCPYNNSHHIRRCRMAVHLVKCKLSFGEQKMVPCDFNATHMIAEPEFQYHSQICPDRKTIEKTVVSATASRALDRFPMVKQIVVADDNWDDDATPSYDPEAYVEKNEIIRHKDVLPPAERRNFKMAERRRHGNMMQQRENIQPPPARPKIQSTILPTHDAVRTNIPQLVREDQANMSNIAQKLRMGAGKIIKKPSTTE